MNELNFIRQISGSYYRKVAHVSGIDFHDILSEAWLGLQDAKNKYRGDEAFFKVYAWKRIGGHIDDSLRRMDRRLVKRGGDEDNICLFEDQIPALDDTFESAFNRIALEQVYCILLKLKPRSVAILLKRYCKDRDLRDIADEYGMTREAIWYSCKHTIQKIQGAMNERCTTTGKRCLQ